MLNKKAETWGRFLCCILFRLCNIRTVPMFQHVSAAFFIPNRKSSFVLQTSKKTRNQIHSREFIKRLNDPINCFPRKRHVFVIGVNWIPYTVGLISVSLSVPTR